MATLRPGGLLAYRVLVVDDDLDMREALSWSLLRAGYDVVTADGGASALSAAREGAFAVVVSDYRMPGMDGCETITALKLLHPAMRAIIATGYSSPTYEAECRARGADRVLRKPFDFAELLQAVEVLL